MWIQSRKGSFLPKYFWVASTSFIPASYIRSFQFLLINPNSKPYGQFLLLHHRLLLSLELPKGGKGMNHSTAESSSQQQLHQQQPPPHHFPPSVEENTNPFYREDLPHPNPTAETNPFLDGQHDESHLYPRLASVKPDEKDPVPEITLSPPPATASAPSSSSAAADAALPSSSSAPPPPAQEEKWGTCVMGTPAVPTVHPDNTKAALWGAAGEEARQHHHPYVQYSPIDRNASSGSSPMENILHMFNSWSNKAETMASNIWHNCTFAYCRFHPLSSLS